MKSVVQSLYLLTTAGGNLIDIFVISFVAGVFSSQAYEFFLFAGLMLLNTFAMIWLAGRSVWVLLKSAIYLIYSYQLVLVLL